MCTPTRRKSRMFTTQEATTLSHKAKQCKDLKSSAAVFYYKCHFSLCYKLKQIRSLSCPKNVVSGQLDGEGSKGRDREEGVLSNISSSL